MNGTKRWDRLVPLGLDAAQERKWLLWGLLAGPLTNLRFLTAYAAARQALYERTPRGMALIPGAVIEPFSGLLGWGLYGCFLAAAAMAALALLHWRYHYRESRSIYLMRRLPSPWELRRRCLALPALGAAAYLLEALLLYLLDLAVYRLLTPAQCLL